MTRKEEKLQDFDANGLALSGQLYGLPFTPEESDIVLIQAPWEATVSYRTGTAEGPAAILKASAQVDLYDSLIPDGWKHGFALLPEDLGLRELSRKARAQAEIQLDALIEGGFNSEATSFVNESCVTMINLIENKATEWLERDKIVGLIGGDHSTPLGLMKSLAKKHSSFGILQLDAHMDLRKSFEDFKYSHASIMYNALEEIPAIHTLVQVGIRDYCIEEKEYAHLNRVTYFLDDYSKKKQLNGSPWSQIVDEIIESLPEKVYISFDIDGLDPSLCPNTGTPVPGGLRWEEAIYLLEQLVVKKRKIIGFDLNEVTPFENNEWDAAVGARLLFKLCNVAIASKEALS